MLLQWEMTLVRLGREIKWYRCGGTGSIQCMDTVDLYK